MTAAAAKTPVNETSLNVYYDKDCDLSLIQAKNIVVVGYGSQGHAHALNLKDSGCKNVRIALKEGSKTAEKAKAAGFEVMNPKDAAKWADVVMVLTPDEFQAEIYATELARALTATALAQPGVEAAAPVIRLDGHLRKLDTKVLESDDTVGLMKSITPERCQTSCPERLHSRSHSAQSSALRAAPGGR